MSVNGLEKEKEIENDLCQMAYLEYHGCKKHAGETAAERLDSASNARGMKLYGPKLRDSGLNMTEPSEYTW